MRRSLTRRERLSRSSEIRGVIAGSRPVSCKGSRLYAKTNDLPWNRVAVVAARGHRRAVDRNTEKRRLREIFRNVKGLLVDGYDLVVVAYPGSYTYADRHHQFMDLATRAGLIRAAGRREHQE